MIFVNGASKLELSILENVECSELLIVMRLVIMLTFGCYFAKCSMLAMTVRFVPVFAC
jgi:hypothetical protein